MAVNEEIVLGEGVAIDAGSGSVVLRVASGVIDAIIMYGGFFTLLYALGPTFAALNGGLAAALGVTVVVGWFVGVPTAVETLTRGLSLGRLAVGLRIVRDDGGPISVRYAAGRALVGLFEVYACVGFVAMLSSFLSDRGKRAGDHLAGTFAMRTRGGRTALPPLIMPFGLREWAQVADTRRLPDGLALTARLFLGRAGQMTPEARRRFGTELAAEIAPLVSPPPPGGTHPESFIAAVLATRRDREYIAGARMDQASARETARLSRLPFGMADADN